MGSSRAEEAKFTENLRASDLVHLQNVHNEVRIIREIEKKEIE